jgi:hypothetical protein
LLLVERTRSPGFLSVRSITILFGYFGRM